VPTTITKVIATDGSGDYTTLAAWFAGCPANLVTSDEIWDGQCKNVAEFTSASQLVNITGTTVDATRYIVLECQSGQSFRDNANVRTNALDYNQTNGVGIRCTGGYTGCIKVNVDFTRLVGLQVKADGANGQAADILGAAFSHTILDSCIFKIIAGGSNVICDIPGTAKNCLFINTTAAGKGAHVYSNVTQIIGCTFVSTQASSGEGLIDTYNNAGDSIIDTAVFGFAAFATAGNSFTGNNNATDVATAVGSSNQVSKTFASQFVSTSNDFRAKAGADLINNGVTNANILTDISKTTRSVTTPTIGCWEVVAAAAGAVSWLLRA
jgi:hypothetical protein